VAGDENLVVYSGTQSEGIYLPEGGAVQSITEAAPPIPSAANKEERILFGARVYSRNCLACHQESGQGIPGAFPPLAGADYLLSDPERAISVLLDGLSGEITVNGQTYDGVMPAVQLSDEEVANVLTYTLNTWGNDGGEVSPQQVASHRNPQP
jgi:nitrite reductase (NO-forming)